MRWKDLMARELTDLLLEWEHCSEAGEIGCLERLTASHPELADDLRKHVALLQSADHWLALDDLETKIDVNMPEELEIPKHLTGFEIRRVIGRGGMGVVLEAHDNLDRSVALKTVYTKWPPWLLVDQTRLEQMFGREGRIHARLKHPNIVTVHANHIEHGHIYLVMEHLLGGNLAGYQKTLTSEGPHAVLVFMEKVARAVHYAHQQGVLHRDLKPSNILLDENKEPKVSDFGLARLFTTHSPTEEIPVAEPVRALGKTEGHTLLTEPSYAAGTAPYMAPELFDSTLGTPSQATDVWSLGVILYELLTGSRPFPGSSRQDIAEAVFCGPPKSMHRLAPGISRRIELVVERCLTLNPQARTRDAGRLADELAQLRKPRFQVLKRVSVIAIAAGLPLLLFLAVLPNEAAKNLKAYNSASERIIQRIKKGESVDLVKPGEMPAHYVREGVGATEVAAGDNGVSIFAPALSLVELLPRDPVLSYQIDAEIEHIASHDELLGHVGVYCKAIDSDAGSTRFHLLSLVRFSDWKTTLVPGRGPAHVAKSTLFCFAVNKRFGGETAPYLAKELRREAEQSQFTYPPESAGSPNPSRIIKLHIHGPLVLARWESGKKNGPQKAFASMDGQLLEEFLDRLESPGFMHIDGITKNGFPRDIDHGGIGLIVACGHCLVRNFRITPVPNE